MGLDELWHYLTKVFPFTALDCVLLVLTIILIVPFLRDLIYSEKKLSPLGRRWTGVILSVSIVLFIIIYLNESAHKSFSTKIDFAFAIKYKIDDSSVINLYRNKHNDRAELILRINEALSSRGYFSNNENISARINLYRYQNNITDTLSDFEVSYQIPNNKLEFYFDTLKHHFIILCGIDKNITIRKVNNAGALEDCYLCLNINIFSSPYGNPKPNFENNVYFRIAQWEGFIKVNVDNHRSHEEFFQEKRTYVHNFCTTLSGTLKKSRPDFSFEKYSEIIIDRNCLHLK